MILEFKSFKHDFRVQKYFILFETINYVFER